MIVGRNISCAVSKQDRCVQGQGECTDAVKKRSRVHPQPEIYTFLIDFYLVAKNITNTLCITDG